MNRNDTEGEANALQLLVGNLLPQDRKSFVLANFLTALDALPFGLGLAAAMLTRSFLIMMLACVLGGAIFGTALCCLASALLVAILFSVFWPQLVLFRQSHLSRLRNCLLFFFPNFLRCLAAGLLQVAWWVLMLVLYPGSLLLLLFLGFWLILYWTYQILYPALNRVFQIEEKIAEMFPEQCM